MTEEEQKKQKKPAGPPATGTLRTWGEETFDSAVYGWGMFGLNLVMSAVITYWAAHNHTGQKAYEWLKRVYGRIGVQSDYMRTTLTNAFTLLSGGHFVALGIVKPGEDHKSEIVRWLDNQHYGENAEENPEIKAAHQRVDREMKPTWIGTFLARMGGWSTVQFVAFGLGNEQKNLVQTLGKKWNKPSWEKFRGIEGYAKDIGTKAAEISPKFLREGGNKLLQPVAGFKDDMAFQRVVEYSAMDTIYTAITAVTIKPLNSWLMKNVPIFREERVKQPHEQALPAVSAMAATAPQAALQEDKPGLTVSQAAAHGAIKPAGNVAELQT